MGGGEGVVGVRNVWRGITTAFAVLTVLPVGGRGQVPEGATTDLAGSASYFSLVGAAVGLALIATDVALGRLGLLARSALEIGVAALITGGLHLDGLADTCDGLFSRADRQRALAIMRDSRLGALGAAALVFTIVIKIALLASLSGAPRYLGLLLLPVAGRQAIVLAMAAFPAAQPGSGLGQAFARRVGVGAVAASLGLSVLIAGAGIGALAWPLGVARPPAGPGAAAAVAGSVALLGALALAFGFAALVSRRLGGLTGDTYGAVNEVAEMLALLLLGLVTAAGG